VKEESDAFEAELVGIVLGLGHGVPHRLRSWRDG
jgi:hypothetical protein